MLGRQLYIAIDSCPTRLNSAARFVMVRLLWSALCAVCAFDAPQVYVNSANLREGIFDLIIVGQIAADPEAGKRKQHIQDPNSFLHPSAARM